MQRILVTGAFGFVGRVLLQRLAGRARAEVVALARHGEGSAGVHRTISCDIAQEREVEAAVVQARPNVVIHLAGMAAVDAARHEPRSAWDVNLHGTRHLADAVMRHAPEAAFLHVSSAEIYGGAFRSWKRPVDESACIEPANLYAVTKAAADLLIGQMAQVGLRAVRMRPFNHTGPGQGEGFAMSAFAAQIARIEHGLQEPVIRVGNLDARRDFLDVRDVVAAYAAALDRPQLFDERGLAINLASGTVHVVGDLLGRLVAQARKPVRVEIDPARVRPNDTPLAVGDAGRAAQLLGWRPIIPIDKTLADVLDYWRTVIRAAGA
jgi:GDP-4-dehydro-6-deoxy-D-mannose reductase